MKRINKLFLTHIGIAIPVLLTSMMMTFYFSHEMVKIEEETVKQQVFVVEEWMLREYEEMNEKSIILTRLPQLNKNRMQDGKYATLEGVEFLNFQRSFDQELVDMFVTYGGAEKVYSSTGVSSWYNYFRYVRELNENSVERGINAIKDKNSVICFLQDSSKQKFILYSMDSKRYQDENTKMNFIVSVLELETLFQSQYNSQYFEIEANDGSILYIICNENGKISFPEIEEWNKCIFGRNLEKKKYQIDKLGLKINFYYDRDTFFVNQWLMKVQMMNGVIIMIGSFVTAFLSWKCSKKQIYEIASLEYAIEGTKDERLLPEQSIYSNIQKKILNKYSENVILEKRFQEEQNKLKDKITLMIFEGMYHDLRSIGNAFRELGYDGCPKFFYVGMISAKENILCTQIPERLKRCLSMYVNTEYQECFVFLCEIDSLDENRFKRLRFAEEIRNYLHKNHLSKVSIGISRVYDEPMMIERAYREAYCSLNDIITGRHKDFCYCWENSDIQLMGIMFEAETISKFQNALYSKDLELAKGTLEHMLEVMTFTECSVENQYYLRYEILRCVLDFLKTIESIEKTTLIRECINVDITKESFLYTLNKPRD